MELNENLKKHITLPTSKKIVNGLKIGDIVYISGLICTGRDQVHKKIINLIKDGKPLPKDFENLKNSAIYHMGPIVKTKSDGTFQIISGGPTTSARMNPYQNNVCKNLNILFVIGKGGMQGVNWNELPAVYLQFPGGAGAIVSKFIKRVVSVEWKELGPEAAWFLEVENFGPLVVALDTHGGNLFVR